MEFNERLAALVAKVEAQSGAIQTEEATKNAFVMPFIASVLGYDVFDPLEVVPEYTADVGTKRGEKVDYAIVQGNEIQILIECKVSRDDLRVEHASQLFRYFSVTNARIAVLTNGIEYQFFTDLDKPNRMDDRPFLVLDLLNLDESVLPELKKLSKADFDLDSVISAAEELKYVGAIKRVIAEQFRSPSDEWVRALTTRVYEGSFTQRVRDQFTGLVVKAMKQFLSDQVNDRLKTALGAGNFTPSLGETDQSDAVDGREASDEDLTKDHEIVTTLEELEGYQIVKAIACSEVRPQRIAQRDAKSYFAILLDDNNRKPIARLHFNAKKQKYIGLFGDDKAESRFPIGELEDIYQHAQAIRETVRRYEGASASGSDTSDSVDDEVPSSSL